MSQSEQKAAVKAAFRGLKAAQTPALTAAEELGTKCLL